MDDILEAVPIDKYFELFKPKNGGEGGFIRVAMNFSTESAEDALAGRCHTVYAPAGFIDCAFGQAKSAVDLALFSLERSFQRRQPCARRPGSEVRSK